eukprot:15338516-Ditylum_brightwellii.AAC.1
MPEVNKVIYAKHREHGRHNCTYVLLSVNRDTEFLVIWFNHPKWGGIGNIDNNNCKQRKGRNKNNTAMMYYSNNIK